MAAPIFDMRLLFIACGGGDRHGRSHILCGLTGAERFIALEAYLGILHRSALARGIDEDNPEKVPCPSIYFRTLDRIERWGGNIAQPPG